jgi:SAM-dependent methyltransferase
MQSRTKRNGLRFILNDLFQNLLDFGASRKELNRVVRFNEGGVHKPVLRLNALQRSTKLEFLQLVNEGLLKMVLTNCPVCGSGESDFFCGTDRIGLPVETVFCRHCPTLFSRSRLDEASLEVFYSSFYRPMYGGSTEPSEAFFDDQVSNGYKIMQRLQKFGRTDWSSTGAAVLEIGCGAGGVLLPFKLAGAIVLGIDMDEKYMDKGRSLGLTLKKSSVFDIPRDAKFDLIILKDVLEHLSNIDELVELVKNQLSDCGQVFVQVPTFEALEFLGYRSDFLRYFQNAHLVHFSQSSLLHVFSKHDLFPIFSDVTGLAIFTHDRPEDFETMDLSSERLDSLKRVASILNRRKKATYKEAVFSASPKWLKIIYGGLKNLRLK